jgi:hypothetical protein
MSNFLDLRCPRCRDQNRIDILASIWVRLMEDGTDADASDDGDHEWSSQSAVVCGACVGNNLNQLTRRLNEFHVPAPETLSSVLQEIRDIIRRASADGA